MSKDLNISSNKGKIDFGSVESYTHNFSIGGGATGYGAAAFGTPYLEGGNSYKVGAPGPTASGPCSFVQGITTKASGMAAMATGRETESSGEASLATGKSTKASADYAFTQGKDTEASAPQASAFGQGSKASGENSLAGGKNAQASGAAAIALGENVSATEAGQVVVGGSASKPFKVSNGTDLFTVDNQGSGEFLKNLKVNEASEIGKTLKVGQELTVGAGGRFSGTVIAADFVTGGGDYAEFFEWDDGNPQQEDRRYRFVGLNEDRIYPINDPADWILGIISVNPSILGDAGGGKMTDPRYAKVGLLGKLILEDDGTCQPNQWCRPLGGFNGIGTQSNEPTRFRVMKRLDENHIRILILG